MKFFQLSADPCDFKTEKLCNFLCRLELSLTSLSGFLVVELNLESVGASQGSGIESLQ